jgi:hypothetical protein
MAVVATAHHDAPAGYSVYYAPGAPTDQDPLVKLLSTGGAQQPRIFSSPSEWAASEADVYVLRGRDRRGGLGPGARPLSGNWVEGLRGKRVVGIGYEAMTVFTDLGLDLHNAASLEDIGAVVTLRSPSRDIPARREVPVFEHDAEACGTDRERLSSCLYVPPWSPITGHLDIPVRCSSKPRYAPLARQQIYLYCGVAADIRTWSKEFREVVRDAITHLRSQSLGFIAPEWETSPPGTYGVNLGTFRTPTKPYEMDWFFRFSKPTLFSAELTHDGSGEVYLHLFAQRGTQVRGWRRVHAGQTLRVLVPLTEACLRDNPGDYWRLSVSNFDGDREVTGELRIRHEVDGVVQVADGLQVSMATPPTDPEVMRSLLEHLLKGDDATRLAAEAGLIMVGKPALPALRVAESAEGATRPQRVRLLRVMHEIEDADAEREWPL